MGSYVPPRMGSPLLDHCPDGLPREMYLDPEHHALELTAIWARQWINVGRVNDLPPMVVRRVSVADRELLLVKDPDNRIACFHNVCRHRGAELCGAHETALRSKAIACPYHRWTYDLSGKLIGTPYVSVPPDFKPEEHGLFKVAVKVWNGFIFVCLADTPPNFDAMIEPRGENLTHWPMDDLVTGHVFVKEMACNWKVFWENFNECLHCPGIHPELSSRVPIYKQGYMADNEARNWDPAQPPLPSLAEGSRTWSEDGQLCGPEFPDLTDAERARGQTFVMLMPAMFLIAHLDYVRSVTLRPLGPERTELRAEWFFPKATLAAPGFDLDNVTRFAIRVMEQDGAACEMNQRGLRSPAFRHARLMPQEYAIRDFHDWVKRQLAA